MKSKTIIISSQNETEKGRGILTIYHEDDLLKCRLRLYNVASLNRFCKLGVYHNNEVYSANLLEKNGTYTSSMVGDFDIDKDFYTAIIDTSNNNNVILSGGTYSGFFFNDNSVFEKEKNEKKNDHVFDKIEKENPNTNLFDYTQDYTLEDEKQLQDYETIEEKNETATQTTCSSENDCEMCKTCKYKEFFYSNQTQVFDNLDEQDNKEQSENLSTQPIIQETNSSTTSQNETKTDASILSAIIPQFQYVFENYQADETLNNLIPNSKFVKINENKEQYSIGAIYEDDEMKYICYAVLKDYNTPAPEELGQHYQWLPLDKEDPLSEGYFIVFQDANDLKIVEL